MTWEIKLPIRDPDEVISAKSVSALSSLLVGAEDRAVCRETLLLWLDVAAWLDAPLSIADLRATIESFSPAERKSLLPYARKNVGLPDPDEVDAERRREEACRRNALRNARGGIAWVRLPSGAFADANEIAHDTAKEQARAASLAAQRAAQQADREADAAAAAEHRAAREAQFQAELPPHLRSPA
jgi:hypothetical protein